jgi:hypothetical protein
MKILFSIIIKSSTPISANHCAALLYGVCNNKFRSGSPSLILIVLLISLGITTLPRSSILLTIPVAFIYKNLLLFQTLVCFYCLTFRGIYSDFGENCDWGFLVQNTFHYKKRRFIFIVQFCPNYRFIV